MANHYEKAWVVWPRRKPWRARAMVNGVHYHLGYYTTKEEAEATEDEFRNGYRGKKNQYAAK